MSNCIQLYCIFFFLQQNELRICFQCSRIMTNGESRYIFGSEFMNFLLKLRWIMPIVLFAIELFSVAREMMILRVRN